MIEAEEKRLIEGIKAARVVQSLLWGEANGAWGLEEWRRMFRKRIKKIDDIDPSNPHALIELKKRLLQNAALSIALLGILDTVGFPNGGADIPSNLPEYAKKEPWHDCSCFGCLGIAGEDPSLTECACGGIKPNVGAWCDTTCPVKDKCKEMGDANSD